MRLHLTQNGGWMFHEGSDTDPNANEFWTVQVDIIYNCDFPKKLAHWQHWTMHVRVYALYLYQYIDSSPTQIW